MSRTGVLIANLGTPNSPRPKDVHRYLKEFLLDRRVLDYPWLKKQLLVRGFIVPFRYKQSSLLYKKIWTDEGSPLLVHGKGLENKLQAALGENFVVALGMRYQNPSIEEALHTLQNAHVNQIIVAPLFPQYASATTGSVHQKVMESVKDWYNIPKMTFINNYFDHPGLINAFFERSKQYSIDSYDHILFSFHGLPERQISKSDPCQTCLKNGCCATAANKFCYKSQCFSTALAIAKQLKIDQSRYTICFQSRLGKEPWLQPYATDEIKKCVEKGWKRVLVYCPSFVCDCLETTFEITHEYGNEFKKHGGEILQLVEGLNVHSIWVEGLKQIIMDHL